MCSRWCLSSCPRWRKLLSHWAHRKGFSPGKPVPRFRQEMRRSPPRPRMRKHLPRPGHGRGFSPKCAKCPASLARVEKPLQHSGQAQGCCLPHLRCRASAPTSPWQGSSQSTRGPSFCPGRTLVTALRPPFQGPGLAVPGRHGCACALLLRRKLLPHAGSWTALSPLCVRRWLRRVRLWQKHILHSGHWNGLVLERAVRCLSRYCVRRKLSPHSWHRKCLSGRGTLSCCCCGPARVLHVKALCGRWSEWLLWCFTKCSFLPQLSPQSGQGRSGPSRDSPSALRPGSPSLGRHLPGPWTAALASPGLCLRRFLVSAFVEPWASSKETSSLSADMSLKEC